MSSKARPTGEVASLDEAMARVATIANTHEHRGLTELALDGGDHGRFEGLPAKVMFRDDGEERRSCNLIDPISYIPASGSAWPVPAGAWLNGASIPRAFWALIGGPFEGLYLEPSIVHDHYCITRDRPWRDTHRMFHEAMLCHRVSGVKARIMFYAVYRFGPRWPDPAGIAAAIAPAPAPKRESPSDANARSILRDVQAITDKRLSLTEIEALVERDKAVTSVAVGSSQTPPPTRNEFKTKPSHS